MKKYIIAFGISTLLGIGMTTRADVPGSTGHTVDVTPGNWEDEGPKLNFDFKDIPLASFKDLKLTLSCGLKNAYILYTMDQSAATSDDGAWTKYTNPLDLTQDCIVRFFARCEGYEDSEIQSFNFVYSDYQAAAPTIAPDLDKAFMIMVSETPDAIIRYTFDGNDPDETSSEYSGPVEIVANGIFKARTFADGLFPSSATEHNVDFLKAQTPSAVFKNKQLVLSSADRDPKFYYTFGDASSSDTDAWSLYSNPLPLTEDCTVRFFAAHQGFHDSEIGSFSFSYSSYQVAAPIVEADAEGSHIIMTCETPDAEIRYTTDGTEPTLNSSLYSGEIEIISNGIFRARAFADGLFDSNIVDFSVMHLAVPTPSAKMSDQKLVITCSDSNASIWYSTESDPSHSDQNAWTEYSSPIELSDDCVFHFFGRRNGYNDSDIQTFVFVLDDHMAAAPLIERDEDGRSIVMTSETVGAEIRFTTDGTEPTAESELYTEPIFITHNCTFRARAFAEGLFESKVSEYTVSNMTMMMPHASFENLHLNLSLWDEAGTIWFTLDPLADPENVEAWALYSEPIALASDCTVRFFARRTGFLDSRIDSYEFIFADWQVANPVIEEGDGIVTITCNTEGAEIHYTLDGSVPTAESAIFTEPIKLSSVCTVKAIAVMDGMFASDVTELMASGSSGVGTIGQAEMKVCKENGNLVVYSEESMELPIYTLDGNIIRIVKIEPGRNLIDCLESNIYIICNRKFKL